MAPKKLSPAAKAMRPGSPLVFKNDMNYQARSIDLNNNNIHYQFFNRYSPTKTKLLNNSDNSHDINQNHGLCSKKNSPKQGDNKLKRSPTDNDETTKGLNRAIRTVRRMKTDELVMLASSDDDFLIDCVLEQIPMVKDLSARRDELLADVNSLAHCNYAREPQFVNDRDKLRKTLDEVAVLKAQIAEKRLNPILNQLKSAKERLVEELRILDEESDRMSTQFLEASSDHEQFLSEYIELRKKTSLKRILSDNLAKELDRLSSHITKSIEPGSVLIQ